MEYNKNFAWPTTSINRDDFDSFNKWFDIYHSYFEKKTVIIFGAGIRGTSFSDFMKRRGFNSIVYTDNNSDKWGGVINEFPIICSGDAIKDVKDGNAIILVSTENGRDIEAQLNESGLEKLKDYYTISNNEYDMYFKEFKRQYNCGLLVMGDCQFQNIALRDQDVRTLEEMIYDSFGRDSTKVLAMHGMGMRSHYNVFCSQIKLGMKPQKVLLMVNFDTLNGKQHLLPRAQHHELIKMIYDYGDYKDDEFDEYIKENYRRQYNNQTEFFSGSSKSSSRMNADAKSRIYFKLNYMYKLDVETEGVIYLGRFIDKALEENIEVIPYLPPVNYQFAEKLFGSKFKMAYEENVKKVNDYVSHKGIKLLDLSYEVTSDCFAEMNTPDETTNAVGRSICVDIINNFMKRKNG